MRQQIEEARQRREQRLGEIALRFWSLSIQSENKSGIEKAFRDAIQLASDCIRERERAELLQDMTLVELQLYRPTREQREAAPAIDGFCYVSNPSAFWCVAKVISDSLYIEGGYGGGGYLQESWINDKVTLCGKKALFATHDSEGSGAWPRTHEVCPACWAKLAAMGRVERPAVVERQSHKSPLLF